MIGRSSAKLRRSPLTEYCRAGNCHVPAAALALPDGEPHELQAVERAAREMQLGVRELARRIAFVVRKELDCHVVCLRAPVAGASGVSKARAAPSRVLTSSQLPVGLGVRRDVPSSRFGEPPTEMTTRVHDCPPENARCRHLKLPKASSGSRPRPVECSRRKRLTMHARHAFTTRDFGASPRRRRRQPRSACRIPRRRENRHRPCAASARLRRD